MLFEEHCDYLKTKILVTGGRDFTNSNLLNSVLDFYLKNSKFTSLIVGDAAGADALAENWCKDNKIKCNIYVADWKKHGLSAGIKRNKKMIDENKNNILYVIAFPGGRGTKHCKEYAVKNGLNVIEIFDGEPKNEEI